MDHVAIMRPSWKLTDKILSGEKKIESRWYSSRRAPWDRIHAGDFVYFKDSGKPVSFRCAVKNVIQFSGLRQSDVRFILEKYGEDDRIVGQDIGKFFKLFMKKRYCILIFLEKAETVRSFEIDKSGFGAMSAWISVRDIDNIKKRRPGSN